MITKTKKARWPMENNEKKAGFFCRKVFMEQMRLLKTPAQFLELFGAAYAYVDEEDFNITDDVVKMAFSSWKLAFDYDKKKDEEYHKERKRISTKANEAKKKKREAKGNILMNSPSDESTEEEPPLAEAEQVEQYPFEEFWKLYDMKVGEDDCRKKWSRMRESTKAKVMEHLPKYIVSTPNKKYRVAPLKYLEKGYYNNEVIDRTDNPQSASNYGNNNKQFNDREAQRQQNLRAMGEWLAEAAANVQPIDPTESGI